MEKLIAVNEYGIAIGEDHHNAKYSNGEIDMVLDLREQGWGYKRISKATDMPIRTVRDICNGKRRCQMAVRWRRISAKSTRILD